CALIGHHMDEISRMLISDTTGIAIGGLAGLYYGFDVIPEEWLGHLARREDIGKLFKAFARRLQY
ncbi:MAG: hypothetical protein J4N70_10890, partial [Chloroflexi bacterium]|nr:hypothetical protein [Chloroflexota bacterium]